MTRERSGACGEVTKGIVGRKKTGISPCYETTAKKKTLSYMFINLMGNIQKYNEVKI